MPMRIYPAPHYTMGGLWVDYHLMSNIPGLFVAGEANFSDHGANRLGASALMQGLADGYFVIPATVPDYLATTKLEPVDTSHPAFAATSNDVSQRIEKLLAIKGNPQPRLIPQGTRQAHVGRVRDGPIGGWSAQGSRQDPGAA